MADFYAARSGLIPPLPWPTFAPPFSIGALSAGIIADFFGLSWAIASIAVLTFVSGVIVAVLMREGSAGSLDPGQGVEPKRQAK